MVRPYVIDTPAGLVDLPPTSSTSPRRSRAARFETTPSTSLCAAAARLARPATAKEPAVQAFSPPSTGRSGAHGGDRAGTDILRRRNTRAIRLRRHRVGDAAAQRLHVDHIHPAAGCLGLLHRVAGAVQAGEKEGGIKFGQPGRPTHRRWPPGTTSSPSRGCGAVPSYRWHGTCRSAATPPADHRLRLIPSLARELATCSPRQGRPARPAQALLQYGRGRAGSRGLQSCGWTAGPEDAAGAPLSCPHRAWPSWSPASGRGRRPDRRRRHAATRLAFTAVDGGCRRGARRRSPPGGALRRRGPVSAISQRAPDELMRASCTVGAAARLGFVELGLEFAPSAGIVHRPQPPRPGSGRGAGAEAR